MPGVDEFKEIQAGSDIRVLNWGGGWDQDPVHGGTPPPRE